MIRASDFRPAWWLRGAHRQTLWPVLFRKRPALGERAERVELPDGDFLDIAWVGDDPAAPLVLVLHGLEGCITSHYAAGLLDALRSSGLQAVFMHFRGCSGEPNRLPRGYHSGETGDLSAVVAHIQQCAGIPVSAVIGFSLGGNVLLKWLGEGGRTGTLRCAVAVSVPFLLDQCAARLDRGWSTLYRNYLLRRLKASYRSKFSRLRSPLQVDLSSLKRFRDFDHQVTAPLHGFEGVDHYYRDSSSRQYLARITTETLILHSADDPFMWPETVPQQWELSDAVTLELSQQGGHVGFVSGPLPWKARYWLDQRIVRYLADRLQRPP